jgi:hypothetical protein
MDAEAASVLQQLIAIGAAEGATVLSMGIPYMNIQVSIVCKLTITMRASDF